MSDRAQEIIEEWAEAVGASVLSLDDWPVEKIVALEKEIDRLKKRHEEIVTTLYEQGFEVLGWNQNGDLEPLDNFFDNNGWLDDERTDGKPAE